MFIKRFYMKLLSYYFDKANFAKPTGDGLLLIFKYDENTLFEISKYVLTTAVKVMNDFPGMFDNDPMVNFATPNNVGFGITRGTACCLYSGRKILDYTGQFINLAARLNDYARPRGIVIDGTYKDHSIPEELRTKFKTTKVFIRGIADHEPREVLYLSPEVTIPDYAFMSLINYELKLFKKTYPVKELKSFSANRLAWDLPEEPVRGTLNKLKIYRPDQKEPKFSIMTTQDDYQLTKTAKGWLLSFPLAKIRKDIAQEQLSDDTPITFDFEYVPAVKPEPSKNLKKPRHHAKKKK